MALPERLGGLGLLDPSLNAEQEYNASLRDTAPLRQLLNAQDHLLLRGTGRPVGKGGH